MSCSSRHRILAAAFCLTAACGREPAAPVQLPLSDPGRILLGTVAYPGRLHVMLPDGSEQHLLTRDSANYRSGHWSPDGRQIISTRRVRYNPTGAGNPKEIYVMNADGSGMRRLYGGNGDAYWPKWSPDGSRIAFHQDDPGIGFRIWVMRADGTEAQLVTGEAPSMTPEWSPDGTMLLYAGSRQARNEYSAYVIRVGGYEEELLGGDEICPRDVFEPRWSPDGFRIAYRCGNSDGSAIHVMNADGTSPKRLSIETAGTGFFEVYPVWSPDGTRIAFASNRSGFYRPWVMDSSGANVKLLLGGSAGYGLLPVHWGAAQP